MINNTFIFQNMGKKYVRKTTRASFSEVALAEAMGKVTSREMGVNEASRAYGIASRTLRRHLLSRSSKVQLGRRPELGDEHERRLTMHIKALEKVGFAPDSSGVKKMAFSFAEKLGLNHRFSREAKSAGDEWFHGFLRRNKDLSIRKSEGLSLARAKGMNRTDVDYFFNLLLEILTTNNLLDKPGNIFNVDETGIQINNKPGKVLATKGAKDVYSLTTSERGENVSLVSCCSAEGYFLPPVLIFKGKNKKDEFLDGLPPGAGFLMNTKSSYINSDLFLKWFKEFFLPKKRPGKALLILDGHASHCNAIDLLNLAAENEVVLLCLPSHTTQALQPLDRAFFKPLKTYFFQEAKHWMIQNKNRKLSRINISRLIGNAWGKAATVANGTAGFRACGIHPYNPQAIPEHFFSISDASLAASNSHETTPSTSNNLTSTRQSDLAEPSTSGISGIKKALHNYRERSPTPSTHAEDSDVEETPSKFLREDNPIPLIPHQIGKRKQHALELTSPENRAKRQVFSENKKAIAEKKENKKNAKITKDNGSEHKKSKSRISSSSSSESEPILSSSDEQSDDSEDFCVECSEYYYTTKSKVDWIQCLKCSGWLHETCKSHLTRCSGGAKKTLKK